MSPLNLKGEKMIKSKIIAYIKGIVHLFIIPYIILWIFQDFGVMSIWLSLLYILAVNAIYIFTEKRNDLSAKVFLRGELTVLMTIGIFYILVIVATYQN